MSKLEEFAKEFPHEDCNLWEAIQSFPFSEKEKFAVARSMVLDVLRKYCVEFLNAYYAQVEELHPHRPFGVYPAEKFPVPAFKDLERTKVLGWVYSFLTRTGEKELLVGFESRINDYLTHNL
jgi:hypothetical protein